MMSNRRDRSLMRKNVEEGEERMMSSRRERSLMRNSVQSLRGSRIAVAAAVGIGFLLGCVFAFFYPHEFFGGGSDSTIQNRRLTKNNPQDCSTQCEPAERVSMMLKMELVSTMEKNAELKKQVRELKEKLRLSEQRQDQAQKQVQVLGETLKAGPCGTVKSLRTNTTPVVPNETVSSKFISARQADIQFARSGLMKILTSASQMMSGIIHPTYQTKVRNNQTQGAMQ